LNAEQLDILIADTLRRAPHLASILRAVRDGRLRYVELVDGATTRVLGQRQDLPALLLVCDQTGMGPAHFGGELMLRTTRRVCGVTIVVDHQHQADDLAYSAAVEHAVARRESVLLVETHRAVLREWIELAHAAGKADGDLAVIIADPDRPDGLTRVSLDKLEDMPTPRGPVH
jgi:hypothetical protein